MDVQTLVLTYCNHHHLHAAICFALYQFIKDSIGTLNVLKPATSSSFAAHAQYQRRCFRCR